ncbi:MAG: acyl carrier protein, partial [Actinoallomurus sp.]
EWPKIVTLVPAGTRVDLARQVLFGAPAEPAEAPPLLPWLTALVRESLTLQGDEPIGAKRLVELGMESLQCIVLQYKILEETGADVKVEDLLGDRTVAELAVFLADGLAPEAVGALTGVSSA